jgi:hypothetical protein
MEEALQRDSGGRAAGTGGETRAVAVAALGPLLGFHARRLGTSGRCVGSLLSFTFFIFGVF